jgi:hypothetical protein
MKCLIIAVRASNIQTILNHIRVGIVFTVEDHINITLVTKAITYSHHISTLKRSPGIMITAFTKKAKNSTVLGVFQYSLFFMLPRALTHSVGTVTK